MRLNRIFATLLLLTAFMPLSAAAHAEESQVTFEGHGWGHGVGMSQYGSKAMAEEGYSAEEIVEYYYTDAQLTSLSSATSGWLVDDSKPLWINLTGSPYYTPQQVSFATSSGSLTFCQQEPASVGSMYEAKNKDAYSPYVELLEKRLMSLGFEPGAIDGLFDQALTDEVKAFQLSKGLDDDGIVGPNTKKALWPPDSGDRCVIATELTTTPRTLTPDDDGSCTLDGAFAPGDCVGSVRDLTTATRLVIPERKVRDGSAMELAHGDVRIRPDASTNRYHVVLEVGVDDYVKGIDETILSWYTVADEAIKAQAIASRSYAVGSAKNRGPEPAFSSFRQDYCWCHLWSNTFSQVYAGYYAEVLLGGVWNNAAKATAGKILSHPTVGLVTAFFSSSSGGATEANEDAWGGSAVPYLRSVPDPWSLDTSDPYPNPFANWSYTFETTKVADKVGLDELTGVGVVERNQSDSARKVRFIGVVDGIEVTVDKTANWVRLFFGLRSNYFDVVWGDISDPPPPPPEDSQPVQSSSFTDIAGNTFEDDIEWLAAEGVTKGCNPPDNTRFCPEDEVTRGQMAAFLNRYLDLRAASVDHFIDDNDSTFEDDINRLAESGITKGCNPPDNDRFCSDQNVTREQMAAFIVRALALTDNTHPGFSDVPASNTFHADIGMLATAGVTRGCNPPDNTMYCPNDLVTRGEMAAFLHRADALRP